MKKIIAIALTLVLALGLFAGCGNKADEKTIVVAASPTPHAEILEVAKEVLAKEGYTLEIKVFTDYVQPNTATEDGSVDANYFQHVPYLDTFNAENKTHLVPVLAVHYEPFGIYPGTKADLADIAEGDIITIPNDGSNRARALLLLEAEGLITLKDGVGMEATKLDITENPMNLKITEMEAAQIPNVRDSAALAVINGNYALQAGLNAGIDALAVEDSASISATTYANIIVVKEGNENSEKIKALVDAVLSDAVFNYIVETYSGAVVPIF
jgi:D-methionine transport system substrate-binding protein